jgi:hypothetical protein
MLTIITGVLNIVFMILQGYNGVQNLQTGNLIQNRQIYQQPQYHLDNNTGVWYMYYNGHWYVHQQNQWMFLN